MSRCLLRLLRGVEALRGLKESRWFGPPCNLKEREFVRVGSGVEVLETAEHFPHLFGVF